MNTADIRNTDRSQGFFWAIAVPVTAGIVFAAVLLAYHGDKLYDRISQTTHRFRDHGFTSFRKSEVPFGQGLHWNKSLAGGFEDETLFGCDDGYLRDFGLD
jgi:hypothetical protein